MELPPPPQASFASDNAAGVSPEVVEALVAANSGAALAYGQDRWTEEAVETFRALFGADVEVLWCWGGTGANVVALASVVQPWQSMVAVDTAHIVVDECGAPAHFSGATLSTVPGQDGKLTPEAVEPYLSWLGTEHHPQPRVLSISQVSEMGTVYTLDEISALVSLAHEAGLVVHVDGARIANAVAASGIGVREMLGDSGVDLVSFGLTKNGAMYGDAVVYLEPSLAENARFVRKQAGQLPSKARFVAAQAQALLADGLWLRNAAHANAMATALATQIDAVPGVEVLAPPQANAVFAEIDWTRLEALQRWSFFWPWDPERSLVRWMTSFATSVDDVERFVAGVAALTAEGAP